MVRNNSNSIQMNMYLFKDIHFSLLYIPGLWYHSGILLHLVMYKSQGFAILIHWVYVLFWIVLLPVVPTFLVPNYDISINYIPVRFVLRFVFVDDFSVNKLVYIKARENIMDQFDISKRFSQTFYFHIVLLICSKQNRTFGVFFSFYLDIYILILLFFMEDSSKMILLQK